VRLVTTGARRVERELGGGPSLVGKRSANVLLTKARLVERFEDESKLVTQALDGRHRGRDGGDCARLRASKVVEVDFVDSVLAVSEDDAIVEGCYKVTRLTRAMLAPLVGRWHFDTAVDEMFRSRAAAVTFVVGPGVRIAVAVLVNAGRAQPVLRTKTAVGTIETAFPK